MKLHNQSINGMMISCACAQTAVVSGEAASSDEGAPEVLTRAFLVFRREEFRSGRHELV